jgi:Fe-S cluster assembly protein SufD
VSGTADARDRYLALFRAFAGNGASRAPAWLREIREAAIDRFATLGFPSTKQEEWRFTSVAPIAEAPFALSTRPKDDLGDATAAALRGFATDAARLVFVDGTIAPQLSVLPSLVPAGVRIESLAVALERDPALPREHLARHAKSDASAFTALNTAFLSDGAFVALPAGVHLETPIEVFYVTRGTEGESTLSHPRTLIVLGRGARATVVERYVTLRDGRYWTNAVTELVVGEGAHLEHYRVQQESRSAYQIATTHAVQARDSVLHLHPLALGAGLSRHDVYAALAGTGADLVLNGFYLLRGHQHADHHTIIDHVEPHCTSHEFFNGILGEHAHGVFNGRIIVRPGAQRTDSKQTNNNLLLSADARADSQPQLEIYADDVKCTHGSTAGPLDEMALYYLRSRGLSPEMAAGMLTYGFAAEIVGRMEHAGLRAELDGLVRARLAERAGGGRRA